MLEDEVMVGDALPFDELLKACAGLETQANSNVAVIDNDGQNQGRQLPPR